MMNEGAIIDVESKAEKCIWYVLIIDETPEGIDQYYAWYVIEAIRYAYSNNKWIFNQFLQMYQNLLNIEGVKYHVMEVGPVTYRELLRKDIHKEIRNDRTDEVIHFDADNLITKEEIPMTGLILYMTGNIWTGVYESYQDYDVMDETFIPDTFGLKLLLDRYSQYFNMKDENLEIISFMLKRLLIYCIIYITLTDADFSNVREDQLDDWVELLPSKIQEILSYADFDSPCNDLNNLQSERDLISEEYMAQIYLNAVFEDTPEVIEKEKRRV